MDISEIFKIAGGIAGIGGLSIALVLTLFKEIIRKKIFPQLTKEQAYKTIRSIIWATSIIAILGIFAWVAVQFQEKRDKQVKIEAVSNYLEQIVDDFGAKYKDTVVDLILVEKDVRWNESARDAGTYVIDRLPSMAILKVEVLKHRGRQYNSFVITEKKMSKDDIELLKKQSKLVTQLSDALVDLENELGAKDEYSDIVENIKRQTLKIQTQQEEHLSSTLVNTGAIVKYEWEVKGDNNTLERYPGRIKAGLRITFRKYNKQTSDSLFSSLEKRIEILNNLL